MSRSVGVIAEDATDVEALTVIVKRILGDDTPVPHHSGEGCGQIKRKAARWIADLRRKSVQRIVIVHDLDRNPQTGELNDEATLRQALDAAVGSSDPLLHICIPVEELEAWFWACPRALSVVARGNATANPNPHDVKKPKEALMKLSQDKHRRPRYSTNDNRALAQALDLDLCAQRCPSFLAFREFLAPSRKARPKKQPKRLPPTGKPAENAG